MGFPGGTSGKEHAANAGDKRDVGLIPGSGRSLENMARIPQYSFLENPMDRGAWQATVHRVAKRQTQLKQLGTLYVKQEIIKIPRHRVVVCIKCVNIHKVLRAVSSK